MRELPNSYLANLAALAALDAQAVDFAPTVSSGAFSFMKLLDLSGLLSLRRAVSSGDYTPFLSLSTHYPLNYKD